MNNKVRTRMAPSPTGEYHIGHIRTLLFNWALAKKNNGKFVIRIEDTDRERYVEGAVDKILDVILDYGLNWDEGPRVGGPHEPYIQSERLEIYQKYADELIKKGAAYYCFCTKERLDKVREEQRKKGISATKYDRHCLNLSNEEVSKKLSKGIEYVIRLKVPDNKEVKFDDLVIGEIKVNSNDLDDQVLLKSDGFPTYHFAVVVDDHLMEISHIMRGNDWIPSTPKHILLYDAFGWESPHFVHLPNLKELGGDKKLSKRFGSVSAREFLDEGYLPEAVLNFLMLLGWSSGTDEEIFSLDEFVEKFTIENIQKTDLVSFDRQKLLWFNGQYIQKTQNSKLKTQIYKFFDGRFPADKIEKIIPLVKTRIQTLQEFESIAGFFFEKPNVDTKLFGNDYQKHLKSAFEIFSDLDKWELEKINEKLMSEIEKQGYKTGKFFMDLRIAIAGNKVTPPINESIEILGKEETLERIKKFI